MLTAAAVPLTGMLRDQTGSFFLFFMAVAGFAAIVIAFAFFLPSTGSASEPVRAAVPGAAE